MFNPLTTAAPPPEIFRMHWLSLSFSEHLERVYREHYFQQSLLHVRVALTLGILIYSLFGILDAWLVPDAKYKLWYIRFAILTPCALTALLFTFTKYFKHYWQLTVTTVVIVAGLCIIAMISIAPYPASHSYYAGLILVLFFGYTFFKLTFLWSTLAGWLIVIAYEFASIWLNPTPLPILINNNFFFLTANILGMFACYSIQYYLRKEFIQSIRLDEEKKKVSLANSELEQRVVERTTQLEKINKTLKQEITERKRAENALRESEEKYRILIDNADTAIFIAQDGVIKFPNPMAIKLLGFSADELTQMPFKELIHPEDRDIVVKRHRRRLMGEDEPTSYDFRFINRNGKKLWVHINTVLITWEGRPATLNFLRDITSQKRLEAQLRRAQNMEAIGTLAGGVAHDLNNILSGLVSYPELLLLDIPEDSSLRKPMLAIQESGQKAAAIVQDLLTLARRGVSVSEVVNLNQIVCEYLESLEFKKLLSFHPGVKIESNLESNLFNILGSPVHLSKTIMNLISNSAEAMPEGGTVSISTKSLYLDTSINGYDTIEVGEYVSLSVTDTGKGISPTEIDKIFEPFYTKKVMGRSGTGLGMAVVWGTVKDHNGYIDVSSVLGKGTTFILYFPITRQKVKESKKTLNVQDFRGNGESILVIDDVEEQRNIASGILSKMGYKVKSMASGEEAVHYLKENSADLLILDMIMDPGIDGLETYKRINKMHPGQKAIIASGYSESERVKKAQKMGASIYLKKPYSLEQIGEAVNVALNKQN